ncbi:hypothetical protein XI06_01785 [Bradyrhizobium sp. CCBAU 11434]|uniref:hypothetical protein n=1 Tax=Bradyrhizobium sp. CCBAU 11434 TaxID=1630885 RepID=UPI002305CBCB|nr:hypothetical protein [Bradyrhizobium sp. CCBAU 11434]MDA9519109.1 hypothetical protein [Bradyrhizobium sp. CCBAU 11434]
MTRIDDLEEFVHRENLKLFRRQLDLAQDNARRQWLLKRLIEEEAKVPVAAGWLTMGAPSRNS